MFLKNCISTYGKEKISEEFQQIISLSESNVLAKERDIILVSDIVNTILESNECEANRLLILLGCDFEELRHFIYNFHEPKIKSSLYTSRFMNPLGSNQLGPSRLCENVVGSAISAGITNSKVADSRFLLYVLASEYSGFTNYLKHSDKMNLFKESIFPIVWSEENYKKYLEEIEFRKRNLRDRTNPPLS